MFAAFGGSLQRSSLSFVSQAALQADIGGQLGLHKPLVAVRDCRHIGKKDLLHNNATPQIDVDPQTYVVRADGEALWCEPASVLPMAQRYFLF
jgi:urease subunit alpha